METYKKFKLEKHALRSYIFLSGILLTIYCGLLCFDIRGDIVEWLTMTLGFVLLVGGVWMYRLCRLTWVFVVYVYLVRTCMIADRLGWFGECVDYLIYGVFGIGVILCGLFVFKLVRCYESKDNSQTDAVYGQRDAE